jgi:hydroxymethylbilane synthase
MQNGKDSGGLPGTLKIGTRGSDLAMWQARHVQALLADMGSEAELVIIKTQGDRIDDLPFAKLEGKGFFTKELEDAQLDGRVDLAVHSLKDLATESPESLTLAALIGREDPRELLLIRPDAVDPEREIAGDLLPLVEGATVGTSAIRRRMQLRFHRPDLQVAELRGNVPTRVKKLRAGDYDAILIAAAGVARLQLDLDGLRAFPLPVTEFVPAPAQGMLGLQCRRDPSLVELLSRLESPAAARTVRIERDLLLRIDGGCQMPFGVHVQSLDNGEFRLDLFYQASQDETTEPLVLALEGADPEALAAEAWTMLAPLREGSKR